MAVRRHRLQRGLQVREREGVGPVVVARSVEARIDMAKALATIHDPRHRQAWIMYYNGWQIDAKDPAEPTISKRFGVTDRTVRLWLRQAQAELKAWYEAHG